MSGATAAPVLDDRHFMNVALMLGRRNLGRTWPNPAVGAVIVRDGVVVGRGWTQAGGRPHAEIEALARAGEAARGATLYVTLEPCSHHGKSPPCADAVVAAGVARVVSAMEDPNPEVAGGGHARLRAAGIAVEVGEVAGIARRDHAGHILRVTRGRPHVILKLAISRDGKIGGPGRVPVAITGEAARARSHLLRARGDAILIGIGTALADDPALTCRLPGMEDRSPARVVLDAALRLPVESRLVRTARETPVWVFAGPDAARAREAALAGAGVAVVRVAARDGSLDFDAVLAELSRRGVTRLTVEGGARVAAGFVAADLVDEAWIFRAPLAIGAEGVGALDTMPLDALTRGPALRIDETWQLGVDTLTIFRR
jgi:diaminohydroxyphosphoribosylaminopyrimidine deaminase/5-amino-6-(5-phosphoribosylamino)uracil reductase